MATFKVFEIGQVEVTEAQIEQAKSAFDSALDLGEINAVFEDEDIQLVFEQPATKLWCSYVVDGHGPIYEICIE